MKKQQSGREPHWTARQIAEHFQVSRKTVYAWTHRGLLPRPLKIGHLSRWKDADVRALEERRGLDRPRRPA